MQSFAPFLVLIGFLASLPFYKAGKSNDAALNYHVVLSPESTLQITGHTNVNSFTCQYQGEFYQDTLSVTATKGNDMWHVQNAVLALETKRFDCHNPLMNADLLDLLQAEKYPQILIQLISVPEKGAQRLKSSAVNTIPVKVNIFMAGKERQYMLNVKRQQNASTSLYTGHLDLNITDFGLCPPKKMLGLVTVKEQVSIDFNVAFKLVD